MDFLKWLWKGWKRIAHKIARFNSMVLTTVLYCAVLPFVALPLSMGKDPLRLRGSAGFLERKRREASLEEAARQG